MKGAIGRLKYSVMTHLYRQCLMSCGCHGPVCGGMRAMLLFGAWIAASPRLRLTGVQV